MSTSDSTPQAASTTSPEASGATLQRQAKALGDPTRHEIFRYLADAQRSVDIPELTEHLGLHHNAVRQHLAKLVDAGLLTEGKAAAVGRGRPRLLYELHPAADERWGGTGPYERLSLLLSEVIRTGDSPVDVGRRAVRRRRLGINAVADPVADLVDQIDRQGFQPTVARRGEEFDVVLEACPFASTAVVDPDTVCNLHLGMAYGVAEAVGGLAVDELVPKDPRRGHCHLRGHLDHP